jgi:anionic cell wall polymer biosynthesis LytR-Cps2A-Psr (LCP) family protein
VRNQTAFSNKGYTFKKGLVRLDGERALAYIRRGSSSADGDVVRARAQGSYVRGVLKDAFQAKTLLNPGALATAVSVLSPYLAVDKHFDSAYVTDLGLSLRNLRSSDVRTFTLPAPTTRRIGRAYVLEPDPRALAEVRGHLQNDTLAAYIR